jgi:hypothetical protein
MAKFVILSLLLLSGCAIKRIHLTSHEDVLDKLGYVGPHRAVYLDWIEPMFYIYESG